MTVTIVLEMPINRLRASSAVPWKASNESGLTLIRDSTAPTPPPSNPASNPSTAKITPCTSSPRVITL